MSRFGDGEFALIEGNDLKFQKSNVRLSEELKEILKCEEDRLIVCIPDIFGNNEQYTLKAQNYWKKYLHFNRRKIYKHINHNKKYYNSLITRFYMDYNDKSSTEQRINALKGIWNGKNILIVEGEKSRLGIGNDLFANAKVVKRIICPMNDAYDSIDEIEKCVEKINDFDLILIALGPTATVLAYRLFKKGHQALDIGHIDIEYEWYLQGASEKKPVHGKYIGEIPDGDNVADVEDSIYLSQIIDKVGV